MKEAIDRLRQGIIAASKQTERPIPLRRVLYEWEVVFLLGAIARDAGFRLLRGSDKYPDALLEIDVDGEPKMIKAELEYRASRFDHNLAGCDLVICWRKDVGSIGSLPIIELHPLFPELDAETDNLEIDHEKANPALREAFFLIQDWLSGWKLVPTGTGSTTETYTVTFKVITDSGQRSLCSLQYDPSGEYLQLKWFKDALRTLGRVAAFTQGFNSILEVLTASRAKSETDKEYRINIVPEDAKRVVSMLGRLDAVFARG